LLHSKYHTYTHHQLLLLSSKRYKMCLIHVAGVSVLVLMRGVQLYGAGASSGNPVQVTSFGIATLQYSMHIEVHADMTAAADR
jgi:hypothetical protein